MAYLIDSVLKIMEDISTLKPVLFQRDGSLYVASEQGFAQITYGLRTTPEKIQSWEKREQSPEIKESKDVIGLFKGYDYTKRRDGEPKWTTKEGRYFTPITYSHDGHSFTLEEVAASAETLSKLPDDGNIRMITHGSGYHSHKYGYASDGIDVDVTAARVMNRERYLELVRQKESNLIERIQKVAVPDNTAAAAYFGIYFPDCTIITPYLMVNFPRQGIFNPHQRNQFSWNKDTRMQSQAYDTTGSILHQGTIISYIEFPFGVQIILNSQKMDTRDVTLEQSLQRTMECITGQLKAVQSNSESIIDIIDGLNTVHNTTFKDKILRRTRAA